MFLALIINCIYLRQCLCMEVSAPELKPLCEAWLKYTIFPCTDNPLQMGIRTWSAQHLQPGPGVCLWEDEESKDYLISKCFQMAQGFFDICSSLREGIKRSSFHSCQRSGELVLPVDEWGKPPPPGATTASLQTFNRKDSCFSSDFPPQFHNSSVVLCEWIQCLL